MRGEEVGDWCTCGIVEYACFHDFVLAVEKICPGAGGLEGKNICVADGVAVGGIGIGLLGYGGGGGSGDGGEGGYFDVFGRGGVGAGVDDAFDGDVGIEKAVQDYTRGVGAEECSGRGVLLQGMGGLGVERGGRAEGADEAGALLVGDG